MLKLCHMRISISTDICAHRLPVPARTRRAIHPMCEALLGGSLRNKGWRGTKRRLNLVRALRLCPCGEPPILQKVLRSHHSKILHMSQVLIFGFFSGWSSLSACSSRCFGLENVAPIAARLLTKITRLVSAATHGCVAQPCEAGANSHHLGGLRAQQQGDWRSGRERRHPSSCNRSLQGGVDFTSIYIPSVLRQRRL